MIRFDVDGFFEKLMAIGFPLISTAWAFWGIHQINSGSSPVAEITEVTIALMLVYMVATMVLNHLMFRIGIIPLLALISLNLVAFLLWRSNPILRSWVLANLIPAAYQYFPGRG